MLLLYYCHRTTLRAAGCEFAVHEAAECFKFPAECHKREQQPPPSSGSGALAMGAEVNASATVMPRDEAQESGTSAALKKKKEKHGMVLPRFLRPSGSKTTSVNPAQRASTPSPFYLYSFICHLHVVSDCFCTACQVNCVYGFVYSLALYITVLFIYTLGYTCMYPYFEYPYSFLEIRITVYTHSERGGKTERQSVRDGDRRLE